MLKNMTDMRKLVTGLTRLLIAKGAVIGRLRKRAKEEGGTVEAYIGDVEGDSLFMCPFILVLTSFLRPYPAVAKQFVSLRVHPFALPTGLSVSSQCFICVYEGENGSGDLGAVSYRDLNPANAVYHQWVIVLLSLVPYSRPLS